MIKALEWRKVEKECDYASATNKKIEKCDEFKIYNKITILTSTTWWKHTSVERIEIEMEILVL